MDRNTNQALCDCMIFLLSFMKIWPAYCREEGCIGDGFRILSDRSHQKTQCLQRDFKERLHALGERF